MKCIIGHEIKTETGFKVFEAGKEYPLEETEGREKYFEPAISVNFGEKPFIFDMPEGASAIPEEVQS